MTARNIHIAAAETEDAAMTRPERLLPRLRERTNDPAREYASRPGTVRPLPDSVAALILCKTGRRVVERHQIIAAVDGVERAYSSPDSIIIAELNGTGKKVLWVGNRRKPDCIHLLSDRGDYLETLPLKGEATWFSQDEASQAALAAAAAHRRREMQRLQMLHESDTAEAAAREAHNRAEIEAEVQRIVHTFPRASAEAARADEAAESAAPRFGKAHRICAAEAAVEKARGRMADDEMTRQTLAREAAPIGDFLEAGRVQEPEEEAALSPTDFL